MGNMAHISTDAEMRHVVNRVTLICMSVEFRRLQAELLDAYTRSGEPNPEESAFHDALFSLMAEHDPYMPDSGSIPDGP